MSAERTCDEERTLKITLELFMKGGFPNVMSVKRGSGGGEDLEIIRDHLGIFHEECLQ